MTPAAIALALLCCAIWGSNATAVMFTQEDLPPLGTAGLRFLISVPFLWLWFRLRGSSFRPKRAELWPIITADYANYAGYQRKTDREIPLVLLEPLGD